MRVRTSWLASSSLSVRVTGLQPNSTHTYEVTAVDAAENESLRSNGVAVTTSTEGVYPSAPATPSPSEPPYGTPTPGDTASPSTEDPSEEPAGVLLDSRSARDGLVRG